jgi:hypothetical protein
MTALARYFNQPSRAEEYSTFSRLRATFLDAIPLPNMGTWRCYAKGTVASLPIQRLRMKPMGRNDSLTPLRYESAAQEKRNERAAETKNTDRLLKILAKKLGTPREPHIVKVA